MQYANVKPDRLLNLKFGKLMIDHVIEHYTVMDYLVEINYHDGVFTRVAKNDNFTHVVEYRIIRPEKSIIKVYNPDGIILVRQNYAGQLTGK